MAGRLPFVTSFAAVDEDDGDIDRPKLRRLVRNGQPGRKVIECR